MVRLTFLLLCIVPARASAEPRQAEFEVRDVSLWIVDSATPTANIRGSFPSALPASVNTSRSLRHSISQKITGPVGVISFYGRPAGEIDVELRMKSGSFLAHWPPADSAPNRLRWSSSPAPTSLVESLEDRSVLLLVDEDHWFHRARQGDALYVLRGARAERFLAYDAELGMRSPIRLQGGPDKYTVANVSDGPIYDVLIARRTPQGVRVAWLDELPRAQTKPAGPTASVAKSPPAGLFGAARKPAAAPKPVAAPAEGTVAKVQGQNAAAAQAPAAKGAKTKGPAGLFGGLKKQDQPVPKPAEAAQKPARGLFGTSVVPAAPGAGNAAGHAPPQVAPAKEAIAPLVGGVELTLSEPLPPGSAEAEAATTRSLSDRLTRRGLTPAQLDVFLAQYGALLFESEDLIVACRLDGGAIDEKIPISVFPVPTKIVRVPLVVVRNADPHIQQEIDALVAGLGDADYARREAAETRLIELGPLAFDALKKGINHADMEIVIRSERILLKQNQQAAGRQGTSNAQPPAAAPANAARAFVNGVLRVLGN
jgi:hypothetical protein